MGIFHSLFLSGQSVSHLICDILEIAKAALGPGKELIYVKAVRKRFLCLMLALTMVLSSGCSTVVAQAVETLDNTEDLPNTDTELDLGNEITDTETDPDDTSPADEGEDEEILDNAAGEKDGEEILDNDPADTDEEILDNAAGGNTLDNTLPVKEPEEEIPKKEESPVSLFSGLFRSGDKSLGTGTGTERSTTLQDGTTFVLDKYLSDPTGEMNGQNTYDLYLEQGLFDDHVPEIYGLNAPDETYLYFVLDQSSTMAQDPLIDAMNESTRSFFEGVKLINDERMENARAGKYSDIDPDGDVEAQMENHLIKLAGVVGFNNHVYHTYDYAPGLPITSDSAVGVAAEKTHLVNDLQEYIDSGYTADTCMQEGTRTNLAMNAVEEYVNRHGHVDDAFVILITDGRPNCPDEVAGTGLHEHANNSVVCPVIGNEALEAARRMKDNGATIESLYFNWEWEYTTTNAYQTGQIEDITEYMGYGSTAAFLSLISSDYPENGTMGISYDHVNSGQFSYDDNPGNGFGQYTHLTLDTDAFKTEMDSVPGHVDGSGSSNSQGYAGASSRVVDVISMPFELTVAQYVHVYAVPRVPANLGSDKVPTDMDADGIVTDFRWGEESEWVEITDQVSVSVSGSRITVSGFDYEQNALTTYDRDTRTPNYQGNARTYEPGDYGYKLVVQVPINAKVTFGGNGIATNNPDHSNFYPSVPRDREDLPAWEENSDLNPEGNDYILKYPLPEVDLNIYYNIVKDDMRIYAPQTAELFNLVSDANAYIFYTDPEWAVANDTMEARKTDYEEANRAYQEFTNMNDMDTYLQLEQNMLTARAAYEEAVEDLSQYENFTPDGINNQFVDIEYELKEPDGDVVGTLTIPHGTAYTGDNLEWSFTKTNIQESGVYTISCTISPVDTDRSPSGLIYTALDDQETQDSYGYSSTEYSSTGSTAAGSKPAETMEVHPEAYLFQFKITMDDTRLAPRQTLDFEQAVVEYLADTDNPHLMNWEWVCTDGVTESRAEDEPGNASDEWVGFAVQAISDVPKSARDDGRVITINSVDATGDINGSFVPIIMHLMRSVGNLNKNVPMEDRTELSIADMRDNDDVWGNGLPSVIWAHECAEIDECNASQFEEACDTYGEPYQDGNYKVGPVRYLIHVEQNPQVDIHKTTDTPLIIKGGDIRWNVTLENGNEEENPTHLAANVMLVDVLPWNGDTADGRLDPVTGLDGSDFGGDLYYKNMVFSFAEAPEAYEQLKNGSGAVYYTTETDVRTASEAQINGSHADSIAWAKLNLIFDDGEMTATVQGIPNTATAIRFDSRMEWGEFISIDMTANIRNVDDQAKDDRYHNRAIVYNGNGGQYSETVATTVGELYISGMLWEDADNDGLASAREKRLEGVSVKLYRVYNPNNGGSPSLTIDGVQLVEAYDTSFDKIPAYITGSDGTYRFNDLQPGTYYVVAEDIADKYEPTRKGAGTDASSQTLDSECEETFLNSDNDAVIKQIVLSNVSIEHQNFGMKLVLGNIRVWKSLSEIYYPTTMTEEEMADYQLVFTFDLTRVETGDVYHESVRLTSENFGADGKPLVYAEFKDLPVGTYTLSEMEVSVYELESMEGILETPEANISWNGGAKTMTITITPEAREFDIHARNVLKPTPPPPGGDENGVENFINVRVPVSLEATYIGPDPISSSTATTYSFKESDFADIVVTYDDGTQIKLSDGTLRFENLSFVPGTITNVMNSDSNKVGVTIYYAEKGRTVSDSFRVGVDLKPAFRFKLTFDANGSTFKDGSTTNVVNFLYNPGTGHNEVTSGDYKDIANGQMNGKANFTFTGWNTKPDGSGINYDSLTALDAIGQAGSTDTLTLYATWKTNVTFNANGGTLAGGTTAAERALVGRTSGSIPMNLNASAATGLTGARTNYRFVRWNTRADGMGTDIEDYGRITGPVTFYAIYYQYYYGYTGGAQTFTAPVAGWYEITTYGASGGGNHRKGLGGMANGQVYLNAGQRLYVYVGQQGNMNGQWAYNGGAPSGYWTFGSSRIYGGSGGGATDVRYSSSLSSRIIVAGGGGGTDSTSDDTGGSGGHGGGLTGISGTVGDRDGDWDSAGAGAGQTYGASLGNGGVGTDEDSGGGGGGYYGGYGSDHNNGGGGGGSGFISGMSGCATVSGYAFRNASMQTGKNNGNGYATIILVGT